MGHTLTYTLAIEPLLAEADSHTLDAAGCVHRDCTAGAEEGG